jgi:hypothetical protein
MSPLLAVALTRESVARRPQQIAEELAPFSEPSTMKPAVRIDNWQNLGRGD